MSDVSVVRAGFPRPLRFINFALTELYGEKRIGWQSFRDERGVSWPLECIAFLSSTFTEPQITGAKIRTGNTWFRGNQFGIDLVQKESGWN